MEGIGLHLGTTAAVFVAAAVAALVDVDYDADVFLLIGGVVGAVAGFLARLDPWFLGVGAVGGLAWVGVTAVAGDGGDESAGNGDQAVDPDGLVETDPARDFDDVGGMAELKATLRERVVGPLEDPETYEMYDLNAVSGILLYGPPGCGKTHVAGALAGELGYDLVRATPTDITSKWIGEAADNVAALFETARERQPCVLFLDELDAIAGDRDHTTTSSERQMITQLLVELEAIDDADVVVVGATNAVDDVDGAIRRSGRFDERIEVPPPDARAREEILRLHLDDRPTAEDLSVDRAVELTAGYASSDVERVADLAARHAMADEATLDERHLRAAVTETTTSIAGWLHRYDRTPTVGDPAPSVVQPEGTNIPAAAVVETAVDRTLADVPGMTDQVQAVRERVVGPVTNRDRYADAGVAVDGALLVGPPGCGAVELARGVAGTLDRPLVTVTPGTLANRWDESPGRVLADVVSIARANAPSVLLVANLQDLAPANADPRPDVTLSDQVTGHLRRVLDDDVVVIGTATATSAVDDAVFRVGAFDEAVTVPRPDAETRLAVLEREIDGELVGEEFDWGEAADAVEGLSLVAIARAAESAARTALREDRRLCVSDLYSAAEDADPDEDHVETLRYIE